MLLVRNRSHDELAALEATALDDAASGTDHRCHTAFHVLRSAAKQLAVANFGFEGMRHSRDADRVSVAAKHQRPATMSAFEHADDVRPAGHRVGDFNREAARTQLVGQPASDVALASCTRDKRGIDGIDRNEIAKECDYRISVEHGTEHRSPKSRA